MIIHLIQSFVQSVLFYPGFCLYESCVLFTFSLTTHFSLSIQLTGQISRKIK